MMRLEAHDITAGYGEKDVLHQIGLTVETGEFVGLIGPNGCGKSTLLRVLTKTLPPRAGTVLLEGQEILRFSALEIARRIAFVPQQEPALFDFTVRDVVLMGRYPHRTRARGETEADYRIVRQALEDADILDLEERSITRLSGGEHRRVLLARALAQQTPLLLLDEPTAYLDVTHQAELLALTHRLTRERAVGVLAALHDLNQAAEYCDRLVLMSAGCLLDQGSPEQVLTPANLAAAYHARARVGRNPATGRPMILTLQSARGETERGETPRVHVVCGGGSGVSILAALVRHGFQVSAGVLNTLDSDHETATALGIAVASESPFSAIGPAARAESAALLAGADVVLVTPVPFGRGNLANLELVVEAQQGGKRIVLIGDEDAASRDYTDGAASALLAHLRAHGAQRYPRIEDWPELVAAEAGR